MTPIEEGRPEIAVRQQHRDCGATSDDRRLLAFSRRVIPTGPGCCDAIRREPVVKPRTFGEIIWTAHEISESTGLSPAVHRRQYLAHDADTADSPL